MVRILAQPRHGIVSAIHIVLFPLHPPAAAQVDVPARSEAKDWPLLHSTTRLLREGLGLLELAAKAGSSHDKTAAERLARRCVRMRCRC
jgi:hypothetical protein